MTIHKITAGDGYTYLTRQVATGDSSPERGRSAAQYYTETGNPPGQWMGRGLDAIGVSGRVSEEQMTALFGLGLHPNARAITAEYQREHVVAGMTERQLSKVNAQARKAAGLGRPFAQYQDLGPFEERVAARLEAIRWETGREPTLAEEKKTRRDEARRQRRAVAGFDLVFTPVSSISRLWGLDARSWVREAIEQAHYAARDAALKLLEEQAAHTRTGSSGQAQIETHGLIAAVFDHADNRLGEPNLHSHVAISSKVLGVDGKWRALDARGLYRMTVAASETYNTVLENELHARLGVEFEERPDTARKREAVREIKGFPAGVLSHFTRRRSEIEAEYQRLVAGFRAAHGRDPSLAAAHELAQQATLATRKGKKPPRAWAAMRQEWRAVLTESFGPQALSGVMAVVPKRPTGAVKAITSEQVDVLAVAGRVVSEVQEHHSTWTRWSVLAQAQRELRAARFTSSGSRSVQCNSSWTRRSRRRRCRLNRRNCWLSPQPYAARTERPCSASTEPSGTRARQSWMPKPGWSMRPVTPPLSESAGKRPPWCSPNTSSALGRRSTPGSVPSCRLSRVTGDSCWPASDPPEQARPPR